MVLELAIHEEEPVKVCVRKLAIGVRSARTKIPRVQLELNLQIIELQLKAYPSTLPKVKEQHATIVTEEIVAVDSAVVDYNKL